MQLQEAIQIVQAKFMAEAQGNSEGDEADRYQDAFADFPVMMETATQIFAAQIIAQNLDQAQRQAQSQQQAQQQNQQ
jgi:hypothetical protein